MAGTKRQGRSLELLVSRIEQSLRTNMNTEVKSPGYLTDVRTNRRREFDVLILVRESNYLLTVAIECRDRSRKVGVPQVEAFHSKCLDTKVSMGVMVSQKGFANTAIRKANQYGIRCFTLQEAQSFNWLLPDCVVTRRALLHRLGWNPELSEESPLPASWSIVTDKGDTMTRQALFNAVQADFNRIRDSRPTQGMHDIVIHVQLDNAFLKDGATGVLRRLGAVALHLVYEEIYEFAPFNLMTYAEEGPEGARSEIAEATLQTPQGPVKLTMTLRPGQGGKIVLTKLEE